MKHLKMCLNPKIMAGLAAVGVGIYLYAPGLLAAALPLLILAICPLSMVFMMKAMGGGMNSSESHSNNATDNAAKDASAPRAMTDTELEAQLRGLQAQQTALADQLEARRRKDATAS